MPNGFNVVLGDNDGDYHQEIIASIIENREKMIEKLIWRPYWCNHKQSSYQHRNKCQP